MSPEQTFEFDTDDPVVSLASVAALHIAEVVDAGGWDRPALLFGVFGTSDTLEAMQRLGVPVPAAAIPFGFEVRRLAELAGHPAEALVGEHAPDDALGVVLTSEGWSYPKPVLEALANRSISEDDLPMPSEHPDRVEIRVVEVWFRDRSHALVFQERGGAPELMPTPVEPTGRLPAALCRYMGLSSGPVPLVPPVRMLAALVAAAGVVAVGQITEDWSPPDSFMRSDVRIETRILESLLPLGPILATCAVPMSFLTSFEEVRLAAVDTLTKALEHTPSDAPNEAVEGVTSTLRYLRWADAPMFFRWLETEAGLAHDFSLDENPYTASRITGMLSAVVPTGDALPVYSRYSRLVATLLESEQG